jgi:hypothetical protein
MAQQVRGAVNTKRDLGITGTTYGVDGACRTSVSPVRGARASWTAATSNCASTRGVQDWASVGWRPMMADQGKRDMQAQLGNSARCSRPTRRGWRWCGSSRGDSLALAAKRLRVRRCIRMQSTEAAVKARRRVVLQWDAVATTVGWAVGRQTRTASDFGETWLSSGAQGRLRTRRYGSPACVAIRGVACGSQAPALSVVYGGWREDGPEALSRIEDAIESAYRKAPMLGMVYSRGWVLTVVLSVGLSVCRYGAVGRG